jgi:hypothetical protein
VLARSERASWLFPALLVLAAFAVYANSLRAPFLFDDVAITQNPSIRDVADLGAILSPPSDIGFRGRPVANLSAALNYAFGGLDVRGYHVVNVLIHAMAALTLFGLVRRTLERTGPAPARVSVSSRGEAANHGQPAGGGQASGRPTTVAFSAALLWTVHPLATTAVTYISQRTESLMALFYLLTLHALARSAERHAINDTRRGVAWSAVAVGTCAFGMGTKEVMITAPVAALLYDRVFLAGSFAGDVPGALANPWGAGGNVARARFRDTGSATPFRRLRFWASRRGTMLSRSRLRSRATWHWRCGRTRWSSIMDRR